MLNIQKGLSDENRGQKEIIIRKNSSKKLVNNNRPISTGNAYQKNYADSGSFVNSPNNNNNYAVQM